jgi:hypothetical protein
MSKDVGRPQQEHGLAIMSVVEPAQEVRWRPDPDRVRSVPFRFPLLGIGRFVGRQGLEIETERMVEFSISAEVEVYGLWHEVARVDTAHEEVHLHQKSRTGKDISRTVLFAIYGPQDVDRGWLEG